MQRFGQEGRWRLDKQMSDFFWLFGMLVSYRTLVNLTDSEASRHGPARRRKSLQRRPPAPEELVAPILAGLPGPRREARREARVDGHDDDARGARDGLDQSDAGRVEAQTAFVDGRPEEDRESF